MRVLIIGGYGTFGGRLARLLADEPRLELLIGGRSMARAEAFCAILPPGAGRTPILFDRDGDLSAQLAAWNPEILVDATGPWQAYGPAPYRVVEACIAAGVDYLDLADGSGFVCGIGALDQAARDRGVVVLSGVSTCPVLTSAAARRLGQGMDRVDAIDGGIAPSPHAGLGLNVVRAVTAYAGKPVRLIRDGLWITRPGLMDRRRFTIAPPGVLPLDCRLFSLVDTPDLITLPEQWPGLKSAWIGAATVPEGLHKALNFAAWLPRLRLLPSLSIFAPLFFAVINRLRWGAHRGGMFVRVTGQAAGKPVARSWNLIAEGDDGPFIPSMAVEALVRKRLDGWRPAPGARPCLRELELDDFAPLFARRAIATGVHEIGAAADAWPLYRRMLGPAWDALPAPLRRIHAMEGTVIAEGRATVERGGNPLARLVGAVVGFPKAGSDVEVRVEFSLANGVETWRRSFAGRAFSSSQEEGRRRFQRLMVERFGPLAFGLAPVVTQGRLKLVVRRWTAFGLPMPRWLAPVGDAFEHGDDGHFHFDVEIALPLVGRVVRYRGWLERAPDAARALAS